MINVNDLYDQLGEEPFKENTMQSVVVAVRAMNLVNKRWSQEFKKMYLTEMNYTIKEKMKECITIAKANKALIKQKIFEKIQKDKEDAEMQRKYGLEWGK